MKAAQAGQRARGSRAPERGPDSFPRSQALALLVAALLCPLSLSCGAAVPNGARGEAAQAERALLATVREISNGCAKRLAGSEAEGRAASILAEGFRKAGLEAVLTCFPVQRFKDSGSTLELSGGRRLKALPFVYSPSMDPGRGPWPVVVLERKGDLGKARGAILVLGRAGFSARQLALDAAAAGAAALVFADPHRPTMQRVAEPGCPIPMVELGGKDAKALLDYLSRPGEARVRLGLRASTEAGTSTNVAAVIRGGDPASGAPVIVLGAHLDSVESPGADDNASGLACLLELAKRLAARPPAAEIWLVGFGAEEVGEIGSGDFVMRWEGPPIDAMFAIDTVGSGSTTMVYSLHGSPNAAVAAAIGAGSGLGIRVEAGSSEYSDHLPFAMAGIPAAFIMRLPEERRHTAGDVPASVDGRALAETTDLVEAAVRKLALDAEAQALR